VYLDIVAVGGEKDSKKTLGRIVIELKQDVTPKTVRKLSFDEAGGLPASWLDRSYLQAPRPSRP
jgi:hypothetical protein